MALASQLDHPPDHNPSNKCLTHKQPSHGQLRSSYRRPSFAIPYATPPLKNTFNLTIRQLTSLSTETKDWILWNFWKTPLKTQSHFRLFLWLRVCTPRNFFYRNQSKTPNLNRDFLHMFFPFRNFAFETRKIIHCTNEPNNHVTPWPWPYNISKNRLRYVHSKLWSS